MISSRFFIKVTEEYSLDRQLDNVFARAVYDLLVGRSFRRVINALSSRLDCLEDPFVNTTEYKLKTKARQIFLSMCRKSQTSIDLLLDV